MANISDLSNELLILIVTKIRGTNSAFDILAKCMLVNKRWNAITTPLLYGNVALNPRNLELFLTSFNSAKYSTHVRSLTIKLDAKLGSWPMQQQSTSMVDLLSQDLIIRILESLKNLAAFSLILGSHLKISRDALAEMMRSLPETCVHLELDTNGGDAGSLVDGGMHLCESIRDQLPRLRNLRIRVGNMCACMFGTREPLDNSFTPVKIPHIESLVVNCAQPHGSWMVGCENSMRMGLAQPNSIDGAWYLVTPALKTLVDAQQDGLEVRNRKIYAITATDHDDNNRAIWQCIIRADVVKTEGCVFPLRSVWMESAIPGSWLARLHDGREVMGKLSSIEAIAEGQTWRHVIGGGRLPYSVLCQRASSIGSFAAGCIEEPLSLKSSEQWRQDNPRKSTYHWRNEMLTKETLFEAKVRTGEEWLSTEPITERTPEGWERGWDGSDLEKMG